MSLLVVGTVALDSIETPFGKAERVIGGSATYFSAAAGFYSAVDVVAVVGGDFPQDQLEFLKARNVNFDGLEVKPDDKSFFWAGKYHHDLNTRDTLATDLNVLAAFDPKVPEAARRSKYVFLANFAPELQRKVLDQVEDPAFVAMDTMDFWIKGSRDALDDVVSRVDCIVLNDEEARQFADEASLLKAAKAIQKMGPRTVVIKKGEHGALMFNGDSMFAAPAYPLEEVFDPTGAGDTFAGGFMGSIAAAGSTDDAVLRRAIIKGSALASFCVERFGVERMIGLTRDDVLGRVKVFESLTDFGQF